MVMACIRYPQLSRETENSISIFKISNFQNFEEQQLHSSTIRGHPAVDVLTWNKDAVYQQHRKNEWALLMLIQLHPVVFVKHLSFIIVLTSDTTSHLLEDACKFESET
jgi:hypothetical protein